MNEKSEVGSIFKKFIVMVQTQFQTKIQILQTDNAKEHFEMSLGDYLENQGIVHQSSSVDTPQQNRIAERKSMHLLEVCSISHVHNASSKIFLGRDSLDNCISHQKNTIRSLEFSNTLPNSPPLFSKHSHFFHSSYQNLWVFYICLHTCPT
ncbi:hypothetical protein ACH5RR_024810 [Cinchona calisaya]|uniref:Integrase catalytic domain-containing protein n=1 Tax=Cinchona calisaya TaxID=153742 RepID=A0ABD2YYX0_9GENT